MNCMEFPRTVEEFMEEYKMVDTEQVYSNGTEFVPIFRMNQWFEHERAKSERKTGKWIPAYDGRYLGGAYWFNCSECDRIVPGGTQSGYNYCPRCGSHNGGNNETDYGA